MKLSARNQIRGTVIEVRKGQTTAHVRIDIGNGMIITSSITNDAVDDLADGRLQEVRMRCPFRQRFRKSHGAPRLLKQLNTRPIIC